MPPRYKQLEECRDWIARRGQNIQRSADDNDPEKPNARSVRRYVQDLRWYDHWLDGKDIECPTQLTAGDAFALGTDLSSEFNGTTPSNRWRTIYGLHDWLMKIEVAPENPLERWNDDKKQEFGITKSTEQSKHLEDGEPYAVSQEEVRLIEEHVGPPKIRNQCLVRLLWQCGLRRGEASYLTLDDLDRENREVTVRASVAKNGKKRVVPYQRSLDGLLTTWLDNGHRKQYTRGDDIPYVFVGERGGRLSEEAINEVVVKAADRAGINRRLYADANAAVDDDGNPIPNRWKISAHSLRVGLGTHLANNTDAGIYEISKLLGHRSVSVTESRYVDDDPRAGLDHGRKYGPD